jgi:hypothetical protein
VILGAFLFVRIRGAEVLGDADPLKNNNKNNGDPAPAGPPATALEMAGGAH